MILRPEERCNSLSSRGNLVLISLEVTQNAHGKGEVGRVEQL